MTVGLATDVCLILEGTYPYVSGGVSAWVHDLLKAQSGLKFSILSLMAEKQDRKLVYEMPPNVVEFRTIYLQQRVTGSIGGRKVARMVDALEAPLTRFLERGGGGDLKEILTVLSANRDVAKLEALLNSHEAWTMLVRIYEQTMPTANFLDYFWSWRSLVGGLLTVLTTDLPRSDIYHAVSTGYAGMAMARATLETGKPGILSEHGIYTNERRIEIAMADWLSDISFETLDLEKNGRRSLRDFWIDAFVGYSHATYQTAAAITTLYKGNQESQRRDGAPTDRMRVIPNGIDYDGYSRIEHSRDGHPPTVALIGRVVPIKDVKTFIRSVNILRMDVPNVRALIIGGFDEDRQYATECQDMVRQLGLADTLKFTGRVNIRDYMHEIDVIALTSISEAQPLVILEAGAAGIPSIATDVGACREIIMGRADDDFGTGGAITPLSNPAETARAIATFLTDPARREEAGNVMRQRVQKFYNKDVIDRQYAGLYAEFLDGHGQGQTLMLEKAV